MRPDESSFSRRAEPVTSWGPEEEFNLAGRIQSVLLTGVPPVPGPVQVAAINRPARLVGGDFYDVAATPAGTVRVFVGDVMGKGFGAAMVMCMARTAARMASAEAASPAVLLEQVNAALYPDLRRLHAFLTLCCVECDPGLGTLTCAVAGHPPPLVCRHASGTVRPVAVRGPLIGVFPELRVEECTVPLERGDTVLVHTDGLLGPRGRLGSSFQAQDLGTLLGRLHHLKLAQLQEQLLTVLGLEELGAPARDDLTLTLLRIDP